MACVSVIMPVFNRPSAALRAARSALASEILSDDNIELILVDDCSSPSLTLSDLNVAAVRVLRLDCNRGPAAARNAGVLAARGDYIAFIDSDDVWLPGKLARQLVELRASLMSTPDALVASSCGFYYPNRRTGRLEARMPIPGVAPGDFASGCWSAPGTTLVTRRLAFDRVGLFDESLRRLEDYDWLLRFALAGGRLDIADVMGAVIAPSGQARSAVVERSVAQLEAKYAASGSRPLPSALLRRFLAYMALERGAALLADGHRLAGAAHLATSLAVKPRKTMALCKFWYTNRTVPEEVAEIYRGLEMHRD